MSFPIEEIPAASFVYRQTMQHDRIGPKTRRYPNEAHFELRPGETGLSVNWDRYITIRDNFILLGLTINPKTGKFLNHTAFRLFKFPVEFLRQVDGIEKVAHTPIFNGNPAPIGRPNNQSHSDILYEDDIEIYFKLSNYCNEEFEDACCQFEVNSITETIEELKKLLDNTPFHRI